MKLIGYYKPNNRELQNFPNVAGELLECPCGRTLRWSQMIPIIIIYEREK